MSPASRVTDYDRIADRFDTRYRDYGYDGVRETLLNFLGPQPSYVLEVGCGTGHWLAVANEARLKPSHEARLKPSLYGIDPSERMLAQAAARSAKASAERPRLVQAQAEDLPWCDATFERLFCVNSLHHFTDRARFFAEAWRVLKPGGRLAGQDWMAGAIPAPARQALVDRICATWAIPALDTVEGYAGLMRGAGFDVTLALDMREEMDLLRGFMATPAQRMEVAREACRTASPIRRMIMEGLLVLGEAAERGAFTVGRFLAVKRGTP